MPDSRSYITHYVKYFNIKAPGSLAQVWILLFLGAASGALASVLIHPQALANNYVAIAIAGVSTGVMAVTLPALLTAAVVKTIKRRMKVKHALLATLIITVWYAIFLVIGAFAFFITKNTIVPYVLLILFNAAIYGYWFLLDKMVIGKGRSAIPIAAVQPLLNILFYLPLGNYILSLGVPIGATLIKLGGGMLVFLLIGYLFLYLIDRPAKKMLEVSGTKIFVTMVGQWLYDLTNDVSVIGRDVASRRDLEIDVLAFRGKEGYKSVFVNPDIHFGPFRGIGGSIAPYHIGHMLVERFGAAPVVLHTPLDIQDNPISTSEVYAISKRVENLMDKNGGRFERAYGGFSIGESGECRAINISLGDVNLFLLTRAPNITEDIERSVGIQLRDFAAKVGGRQALLVDAHNSRFESASKEELDGIQQGSRYIKKYETAIKNSVAKGTGHPLSLGTSYKRLSQTLGNPKDVGDGYTTVSIFRSGSKNFCLVYFDSNNMLPSFRNKIREHITKTFKMDSELCTTDTHAINTVAYSASTALGRYTDAEVVIPVLDTLIREALKNLEPVSYSHRKIGMERFAVWGDKADALIERTSRDVRRVLKYGVPLLAVVAFVVAAWVIYVI